MNAKIQCTGCGKYFSRDSTFDLHRIGQYHPKNTRRCMTDKQVIQAGLASERRIVKVDGEQDVWFSIEQRDRYRNAFSRGTGDAERALEE